MGRSKLPNPLLLPVEVGRPKIPSVDLPPPDHTYGIKSDLGGEGAGAVIGAWAEHAANAAVQPGRDFRQLNRMAIAKGAGSNAQQVAHFRRNHDARLKGGQEKGSLPAHALPSAQDPAFSYGIKSGVRVSMDALMANQYQNDWVAEQGKKEDQYQMAKKTIPVTHTRASLGHRYVEPVVDDRPPFKMKKFANVAPRV
uniref:Flagellar associated protein n=1 Tax=Hemiselmis tepida TaxID=464990 RepID=A0A7S0YX69_9CRYP|mmetsp:Transcript_27705/g.70295  ORF Transcript_27705/g.70295 Transcript_27705/m.70295 type:complete len:197 (+) Transcript_27705:41-631(+)